MEPVIWEVATACPIRTGIPSFGSMSRRGLLQGAALSALALGSAGLLSACGTGGAEVRPGRVVTDDTERPARRRSASPTGSATSTRSRKDSATLEKFEEETGIEVTYADDVTDNETFFAKVSNQLGSCETVKRDMFVLTDWMAARMIDLGWIQKLDHSNMPNVDANLLAQSSSPSSSTRTRVLQRSVAERHHGDRLQRRARSTRSPASKSSSPAGPQGQGHSAHRDARHDGLHAQGHRRRPGGLHRRRVGRRDRALRAASGRGRSGRSPATSTPTTSPTGNIAACEAWSR